MQKKVWSAMALAAALAAGSTTVWSQTAPAANAASNGSKKELVAKLLSLQQGGVEQMAQQMAQQPAMQLMQQAAQALQRVPTDKREALAKDIDADLRKYVEETAPIVRKRAVELAPTTIGTLLDERFNEAELKEIIATLESPTWRKFQGAAGEMQRTIVERLVADTRPLVDPKVQALQQAIAGRLNAALPAANPAAAPAPAKAPAKAPAAKAPATKP